MENLPLFKNKYGCIFSLGSACFCAEMLTKSSLRVFSSPFDWIGGGNISYRINFICNNFQDFLNISGLKKIGEREYPESCDVYHNDETGIVFKHDFPKGMPLEEGYKVVKESFDRKNNRLIEKIKNSKNTLMVYMTDGSYCDTTDDLIKTVNQINQCFEKNSIDLLYIAHNPKFSQDEIKLEKISENIYYAEMFNFNENGDPGNYKTCGKILTKIKLKKTWKDMLFKVSKGRKRMRIYVFGIKILSFEYHN